MKRCPQCEFIYEDDQSLCDMDGILLVFDSQQLPESPTAPVRPKRSRWRARIVPAIAAAVLATVLGLVYYVSTQQQRVRTTYSPASNPTIAPTAETTPAVKAADASKVSSSASEDKKGSSEPIPKVGAKESVNKSKAAEPAKKVTPKTSPNPKAQSSKQAQQKDSKLSSLIKKTSRILKKPFKF